jgi:hypothetical protein
MSAEIRSQAAIPLGLNRWQAAIREAVSTRLQKYPSRDRG